MKAYSLSLSYYTYTACYSKNFCLWGAKYCIYYDNITKGIHSYIGKENITTRCIYENRNNAIECAPYFCIVNNQCVKAFQSSLYMGKLE